MKYSFSNPMRPVFFLATLALTAAPVSGPPFENEQLRYSINWPSGLSLGEAQLRATHSKAEADSPDRRHFEFTLDAGVPGFAVSDKYHSEASSEYCSAELQKNAKHGSKKIDEKTTFDSKAGTASRETAGGGGKTELKTGTCAKDALDFLYFVRSELSQGRIPPPQTVYFGAPYEVRLEFAGTQLIQVGEKQEDADRVKVSAKSAATEINFEVFFLKDRGRTPALVRVPLSVGTTFSMDLVR